jgi:hypothetical protein
LASAQPAPEQNDKFYDLLAGLETGMTTTEEVLTKRSPPLDSRPGTSTISGTPSLGRLGPDTKPIASDLIGDITNDQQAQWQTGSPTDWAQESFKLAQDDAYGQLPSPDTRDTFRLTDDYVTSATNDVSLQLKKAGVRLPMILNQALRKP